MESQFKRQQGENGSDNDDTTEQQTPASGGASPRPEVTSPPEEGAQEGRGSTSGSHRIRGISESQEMFLGEIGTGSPKPENDGAEADLDDITKPATSSPTPPAGDDVDGGQAVTSANNDDVTPSGGESGEAAASQEVETLAVDVTSQPDIKTDDIIESTAPLPAAAGGKAGADDDAEKKDDNDDGVVTSQAKDTSGDGGASAEVEPALVSSSNADDEGSAEEVAQKIDDITAEDKNDDVTDAAEDGDSQPQGGAAESPGDDDSLKPPVVDSTGKHVTFADDKTDPQPEPEQQQQITTTPKKTEAVEAAAGETTKAKSKSKKRGPTRDLNEDIDEADLIADDFYYDSEQYQSGSHVTDESGIPPHLLQFYHSFGYDCCKRSNLHLLGGPTLLFSAGNMVHLVDMSDESSPQHRFVRSCGGGGIGALAVHPSGDYFAVAEKGKKPNIMVYEFPSLKLYRILRGGTLKGFSFIDFNPRGDLLASMGCAPDYMLTVWNWKQERIMLRSKAFSQDIFKVTFAPDQEGQLVSCGTTHIRFWKMAWTFTGLKLKGDLGRFGKTSLTDIEGYLQLPSSKVLSGSDWGNILLWDGGLIEMEVRRKDGKPCHDGSIQQFFLDEGELITVGTDGCVRVWDCDAIETADCDDDDAVLEVEPMNELQVGKGVRLDSMVKIPLQPGEEEGEAPVSNWFAQDANGAIWKLDLTFSHMTKPPKKLFTFTAGPVKTLRSSPNQNLIAVAGDQWIHIHNYIDTNILCSFLSPSKSNATTLEWPDRFGDGSGKLMVVGYEDGICRVLSLVADEENNVKLKLIQAMKPHSSAVTAIAFDEGRKYMVTGGADNTCFFFSIDNRLENPLRPVGFVTVEGKVNSLEFSPEHFQTKAVLVGLDSGKVVEIEMPDVKTVDTSATYLIDNINKRYFNMKSVKSAIRRAEEEARKDAIRKKKLEARKKELRSLLDIGKEMSAEEQADFLANDPNAMEEEEEEELKYPANPSAVLQAKYLSPGRFYLSLDDFDAGYLYECKFHETAIHANSPPKEPIKSYGIDESDDVPITTITFSKDRRNVMAGFKNGKIRVYPLFSYKSDEEEGDQPQDGSEEFELSQLQQHWDMNMHDNQYGVVTSICESFDSKRIFTSGEDGNIFGYNMLTSDEVADSMKAASLSALIDKGQKEYEDILDPNAYSIQDAKLKSEMDRMIALAEEKKKIERNGLAELRKRFLELLSINNELPANVRLKHEEFELDPTLRDAMNTETEEKVARLRLEMQWDGAKQALAHDKLRMRYKALVENALVTIHSFNSSHTVSSYRTAKLTDRFRSLLWEVENRVQAARSGMKKGAKNEAGKREDAPGTKTPLMKKVEEKSSLHGRQAEMMAAAVKKAEETKKNKLLRQQEWNQLYASKPADDYEDPIDVAAIQKARTSMGDYKLKSAHDYVVPMHLRIDTNKKRTQLLRLEEQIYKARQNFNRSLLNFRDRKVEIVRDINGYRENIDKLQENLPFNEQLPIPRLLVMHPDEQPNKQHEFTRESLLNFEEDQRQRGIRDQKMKDLAEIGGEATSSMAGPPSTAGTEAVDELKKRSKKSSNKSAKLRDVKEDVDAPVSQMTVLQARPHPPLTEMEEQLRQLAEVETIHERDRLLGLVEKKMMEFDAELKLLRHHKSGLDVNLKMAGLKRCTLLEELILLKVYEIREHALEQAVDNKQHDLTETEENAVDTQAELERKKKDIEKNLEAEKGIHRDFLASLGRNNKFADYLTKVFKKKIKRKKPKEKGENEEDESDEESSDDDDDFSDDESDDDSIGGGANVFDDTVCPDGCNEELFQATLEMRERRLDIEEYLVEDKKMADQLKKDVEILHKRLKTLHVQLDTAEAAHEAFQVEKQMKLNELDVVVPLHLEQVEIFVDDKIPDDLSQALVFENVEHRGLHNRIKELQKEKKEQKDLYKEARHTKGRMLKNRKVVENRIQELSDECEYLMMTKFGRIVDLDKIDSVSLNRPAVELKEKSRIRGINNEIELNKKKKTVAKLKDHVTELTKENTKRIQRLNVLMSDKNSLETQLDKRQTKIQMDSNEASEALVEEQRRLIQLVQLQSQEIQALKDEIGILSRKGGHILPPAQPPMQEQEAV